ncbi:hypothetical protein NV379_14755 [Paenibacillus sp. N1-5-1-14]|uniref:hypothetical protein n=1 Tax=Paenibacillus radicibacter TaxID=2972488 RepID=UPI0021598E47|nr:hypothetical protein [Paenibacillus radicibacter]MCR8643913.1 hypothetical protein [Paenibacillus radicibacter]
MKLNEEELRHLVFLAEVVLSGRKKSLMDETLQCLLYVVKSLDEAELPDSVMEHMNQLTEMIEHDLRNENDRMKEINSNLLLQRRN